MKNATSRLNAVTNGPSVRDILSGKVKEVHPRDIIPSPHKEQFSGSTYQEMKEVAGYMNKVFEETGEVIDPKEAKRRLDADASKEGEASSDNLAGPVKGLNECLDEESS